MPRPRAARAWPRVRSLTRNGASARPSPEPGKPPCAEQGARLHSPQHQQPHGPRRRRGSCARAWPPGAPKYAERRVRSAKPGAPRDAVRGAFAVSAKGAQPSPPRPAPARAEVTPLEKVLLIGCARLWVATATSGTRGACVVSAADQAPCRARSMGARGSGISGGETPKLVGRQWRWKKSTCGDLPLQKTIFCLTTLRSRLLMHGSAVRGLRLIDTPRRGARDPSCLHGRDCAARKVRRASASEVKGGGGYGHPLTHGPVFQRDKRVIERSVRSLLNHSNRCAEALRTVQETSYRSLPFSNWDQAVLGRLSSNDLTTFARP